ncbi:ras-associating and dilute domain-containing protein-like isoform X2 [Rhincodon typus]|uniref:ras-associating and dilute domain-containing protein-like isoform X2 n=1 Tax=Rhincodon typus TaxID=259920 RepID=UPI00202FC6FF|nr:ras-associating and dilute domain-containing protein-like isoform X2 [Rhincodon typus]
MFELVTHKTKLHLASWSSSSDTTFKSSESFGVRQPARSKIKRHNRGLATVFRGRSFKDEKSGVGVGADPATDDPTELSTQVTAPGVLKIFGDEICAGANYKSVLATPCSSAQELVKEALERYSLDKNSSSDYVLCDVIGRSDEDHQWRTECFRIVSENEKPLILQSLWKPKEGFARRFEMRRKVDVEEITAKEKDTVTAGINAQARRLQMSRARASSALTDEEIESSFALWRSVSEVNLSGKSRESRRSNRNGWMEAAETEEDTEQPCLSLEKEETESSDDTSTQYSIHPPFEFPYFLLLQGYSSRKDFVIYVLNGSSHVFGRYLDESRGEEEQLKVDIQLLAPDICLRHCSVRRQEVSSSGESGDGLELVTLVKPGKGAVVTHNGLPLSTESQLQPGDLLGMGAHYLFMYKDPTLSKLPISQKPVWYPSPVLDLSPGGELTCRMCGCIVQENQQQDLIPSAEKPAPGLKDSKGTDYVFMYNLSQEDALLKWIINSPCEDNVHSKLTAAFLLCLCIQHSASSFQPADFRTLLLRIASQIQTVMWEKSKELAANQRENVTRDGEEVPPIRMPELIPSLQPLVYWMSNSIELLHFIQQEVPKLLTWDQHTEQYGCHYDQLSSTKAASEEAMTVLEEVIMFTFQQSVYYLTKTLYTVLPGMLDSNPFTAETAQLSIPRGVKDVLDIFQGTLNLLKQYRVHPELASQLFAYLFFFTNASLFNALMERGSGGGFYQWTKGVQIRANLDLLLDWIQGIGLGEQAAELFLKFSTAVNLLATPKETLLQANWRSLRSDFFSLNPSQLHHMLREYNPGRPCPPVWNPVQEDQQAALRTADILESFDNHPPLILPSSTFHIELGKPIPDSLGLTSQLERIKEFLKSLEEPGSLATPELSSGSRSPQNAEAGTGVGAGAGTGTGTLGVGAGARTGTPGAGAGTGTGTPGAGAGTGTPGVGAGAGTGTPGAGAGTGTPGVGAGAGTGTLGARAGTGTGTPGAGTGTGTPGAGAGTGTPGAGAGTVPEIGVGVGAGVKMPSSADDSGQCANQDNSHRSSSVCEGKYRQMGRSLFHSHAPGSLRSCQAELAQKLKNLELQNSLPGQQDIGQKKLALDPSCLLTPPNTPQILELAEAENDPMELACRRMVNGDRLEPCNGSTLQDSCTRQKSEPGDEVFTVDLERGPHGLGLALVDGLRTPLNRSGIYIKSLVPDSPAAGCQKLSRGDRILAVNGTNLVGLDYQRGRELLRSSGNKLCLLVAKSDSEMARKVLTLNC